MILGDIGGTKTQLACVDTAELVEDSGPNLRDVHCYQNKHYSDFTSIVSEYLASTDMKHHETMMLGVAGPIDNNCCQLTNRDWALDGPVLASHFGIKSVSLINDLVATLHGVNVLPDSDFVWLQNNPVNTAKTQCLLSAGTGLGETSSVYPPFGSDFLVLHSEGGHKSFAPTDTEQLKLLEHFLKTEASCSVEDFVSGGGIIKIFSYLRQLPEWENYDEYSQADVSSVSGEFITQSALQNPRSIYAKTVDIFSRMLLSEAGNLAMQTYSEGGVTIAGGIAPHMIEFLMKPKNLGYFSAKRGFGDWLERLPLRVCTNTLAPLYGAWAVATQQKE